MNNPDKKLHSRGLGMDDKKRLKHSSLRNYPTFVVNLTIRITFKRLFEKAKKNIAPSLRILKMDITKLIWRGNTLSLIQAFVNIMGAPLMI